MALTADSRQPGTLPAADDTSQGAPGLETARVSAAVARSRAGFFATCRLSLAVGLGFVLLLGPVTSWPGDVYVWYERVTQASVGVRLYTLPGFSYPPVWGYVLSALGLAAHSAHLGPGVLGSPNTLWLRLSPDYLPPVITSVAFNAALKVVLVAMDLASAWLLWRLVILLTANIGLAKRAVTIFVLSPIVLVSVGLHGAFDVLVPLFMLGALVARLEGRPAVSGALLALGTLAKIEPAFLVPLFAASWWWLLEHEEASGPNPLRQRVARLSSFLGGGVAATVMVLTPIAIDGNLSRLIVDVFTRSTGSTSLGGLGLSGLLGLPGLESLLGLLSGRENHVVGVGLEAAMLAAAFSAAAMWACHGRRTGTSLVALSSAVVAATLLVAPVAQPQYLVWLVGPVCALAANRTALRRCAVALGAAGAIYLLGIAGPLLVLSPLLARIGHLSTVVSFSIMFTRSHLALGLSPGRLATDAACLLSVASLSAITVLALRTGLEEWGARRSKPDVARSRVAAPWVARAEMRRASARLLAVVGATLAACEVLSLVPVPGMSPAIVVGAASGRGGRDMILQVSVPRTGTLADDIVAFASSGNVVVHRVAFYEDITYPDSGSTWAETIGVENNLEALGQAAGEPWRFSSVATSGLRALLLDLGAARGTVLVMTSGVLPRAVFSRTLDLVHPWLTAGGILVWSGDVPGYYASGPAAQVATFPETGSGTSRYRPPHFSPRVQVLGLGGISRLLGGISRLRGGSHPLVLGRWYATAGQPSAWASALHLVYPYVHAGPPLDELTAWHATALGYENGSTVSISFLPVGKGGVLLFGGFSLASVVASDTARILESDCLGALRPPAALSLRPGDRGSLAVPVPPGSGRVEVMSFNPLVPEVTTREVTLEGRSTGK